MIEPTLQEQSHCRRTSPAFRLQGRSKHLTPGHLPSSPPPSPPSPNSSQSNRPSASQPPSATKPRRNRFPPSTPPKPLRHRNPRHRNPPSAKPIDFEVHRLRRPSIPKYSAIETPIANEDLLRARCSALPAHEEFRQRCSESRNRNAPSLRVRWFVCDGALASLFDGMEVRLRRWLRFRG